MRCFRKSPKQRAPAPEKEPEPGEETAWEEERVICCRQCGWKVTTSQDAIEVEGKHRHTFFNPAGILFEIGCFSRAPGCVNTGTPTTEFAWFRGFAWRFSSCASCGRHLGWHFQSGEGGHFFGLILNRLVEGERPGGPVRNL